MLPVQRLVCALALAAAALAQQAAAPAPPPTPDTPAPAVYRVKFDTSNGVFIVEVHRDWAPLGADRFLNLVQHGYYDGDAFYRVVPRFVAQWGLNPDPALSLLWAKATLPDEPRHQTNARGTVSFAQTTGRNSRACQVFVNLSQNSALDGQGFAPFGIVVQGFEVVQNLNSQYGDTPDQAQIMRSGAAYLRQQYPDLDKIRHATLVTP